MIRSLLSRIHLFFWNLEFIVIKEFKNKRDLGCACYPFIYITPRIVNDKKQFNVVVNHERIHHAQQIELLVVPFFIWYFLEYAYYLILTFDSYEAYRKVRFERECYHYDHDPRYLSRRKPYAYLYPDAFRRKRRKRLTRRNQLKS